MQALIAKVIPMGGYWWQLMDSGNTKVANQKGMNPTKCIAVCPDVHVPPVIYIYVK
jgi:hypothetical protein